MNKKLFLGSCFVLFALIFSLTLVQSVKADSTFIFNNNLKPGIIHSDVKELQKFLNMNGFVVSNSGAGAIGKETTFFGLKTKTAVILFQKAKNLGTDGIVGSLTRKALNSITPLTTLPIIPITTATNYLAGCNSTLGFSATTGLACSSGNANANVFPAGCINASGFSVTTGFSCTTGLPRVYSVINSGGSSSHHDISVTAIGAITGTPRVGEVLTAGAVTPSDATVSYQWQIGDISGGVNYPNIEGATSSTYTILASDLGKYLDVTATGTDHYSDTVKSAATTVITPAIITSATITSPSPAIGETGSDATVGVGANYTHTSTLWSGRAGATYVAGETPVAVITLIPKAGYTFYGLLAASITVTGETVTYAEEQGVLGGGTSIVFTVTYPQLTIEGVGTAAATGGTHTIVYTLTTGTFAAAAEIIGNWTLGGSNAADLGNVSGIVRSVNDTIATVTVSGTVGVVGHVYTIAPATAAFATGYTAPAAATVTVSPAVPIIATVSTITVGTVGTDGAPIVIVITLTGDTFTGFGVSDQAVNWTYNYGGTGLVRRANDPIVFNNSNQETFYFTGTAAAGTITLKAEAISLTGGVVSNEISIIVPATFADATSANYTTAGNTTITITLAQGSFKEGTIVAADFTFAGTDATAIATYGIFGRTDATHVAITGLSGHLAGGIDNTVTVLGATQASQVTTVTAVAS